jgi:hypothetical protein
MATLLGALPATVRTAVLMRLEGEERNEPSNARFPLVARPEPRMLPGVAA